MIDLAKSEESDMSGAQKSLSDPEIVDREGKFKQGYPPRIGVFMSNRFTCVMAIFR